MRGRLVLLFLLVTVPLAASAAPPTKQPKTIKVTTDTAALFESVEVARDCAAAPQAFKAWLAEKPPLEASKLKTEHARLLDARNSLTDAEWAEKERIADLVKAAEARDKVLLTAWQKVRPAEPDVICRRATAASLVKGAELTVLAKDAGFLKAKVETGRSTGLVGWVLSTDTDQGE